MLEWWRRKHPRLLMVTVVCPDCVKEGKPAIQGFNISSRPQMLDPKSVPEILKNPRYYTGVILCARHSILREKKVVVIEQRCRVCNRLIDSAISPPMPIPADFVPEMKAMMKTEVILGLCPACSDVAAGVITRRADTHEMGLR